MYQYWRPLYYYRTQYLTDYCTWHYYVSPIILVYGSKLIETSLIRAAVSNR